MALVPPPNLAGIPLPPNPPVPPSFGDIARASQYLDGLTWTRTATFHLNPATDQEIGHAEVYKLATTLVLRQNLTQQVQNLALEVARIGQTRPILLANSQASNQAPLYDPTQIGWVLLAAPNPTTCNELNTFSIAQCLLSDNLGLAPLPAHTPVIERKRQIAACLGISNEQQNNTVLGL